MKAYVGRAVDLELMNRSTSGGVGSALLEYLFDKKIIGTAVSFDYESESLRYVPKMIHSFAEYTPVGSIYHEIDLVSFVLEHRSCVKGGFACFALPCQVRAIKAILRKVNVDCFVIGLTCSSQQHLDATFYLLKRVGIRPVDVKKIQYRGNGWPSGVQIEKKNGENFFFHNNTSLWNSIFHSRLFIMKRCFKCRNTLNNYADISLADPWLKEYVLKNNSDLSYSLIVANNDTGDFVLQQSVLFDYIVIENISMEMVRKSQYFTIKRKDMYYDKPYKRNFLMFLNGSYWYKRFILSCSLFFSVHLCLKKFVEK